MEDFREPMGIARLMQAYPGPWGFCGGWALDLWLGRVTRPHKDVDVAVPRANQLALQRFLLDRGWRLEIAHQGELTPWSDGDFVELPLHTIWCRNPKHDPDFFEALLNEADGGQFRFRRDQSITLERGRMFQESHSGLPVLAPAIVLLYKANNPAHEGNAADFRQALPSLEPDDAGWLRAALERCCPDHPWLKDLSDYLQTSPSIEIAGN